jgi:NAD(P) transhydrogenase
VGYDYDLIVIGGGPAGEKAGLEAASLGKRALVIDRGAFPGGAAVHTGTLPSKTLRETAVFLSGREQRETYGVNVKLDPALFVPKLLSRADLVRKLEVGRILGSFGDHHVDYKRGEGFVKGPHAVALKTDAGESELTAEFILVATGSSPYRPDNIAFDDPDIDDSDTILSLDRMPKSLVVLGGGVIGCEYASMFTCMGVKVTLVDRKGELLDFLDMDMSEALKVSFIRQGMDVKLNDGAKVVRREGDHITVELNSGAKVECEKLLFAAGRSSNTKGLGLETAGVELGNRGIVKVNSVYATNVPSILACGDVIGFPALASTSMEQGRVAVQAAFGVLKLPRLDVATVLPYGIYTIPEVSCVGLSEEDAKAKGLDVIAGRGNFTENARAKVNGFTDGFVKIIVERGSRKVIGAHAIGDRATENIHTGQLLVAFGASIDAAAIMVFNYPTLSACFKAASLDALAKIDEAPKSRVTVRPPPAMNLAAKPGEKAKENA